VREPLRKVNESIQQVLGRISIASMKEQPRETEEINRSVQPDLVTLNR
jgi:hypothetical protein